MTWHPVMTWHQVMTWHVPGARFRVPYIYVGPLWDRVDNMMTWHMKKSGPAEGVGVRGRSPWVDNQCLLASCRGQCGGSTSCRGYSEGLEGLTVIRISLRGVVKWMTSEKSGPAEGVGVRGRSPHVEDICIYWLWIREVSWIYTCILILFLESQIILGSAIEHTYLSWVWFLNWIYTCICISMCIWYSKNFSNSCSVRLTYVLHLCTCATARVTLCNWVSEFSIRARIFRY